MTNIFRHLLYEEKTISAFKINEEGTMDYALYEVIKPMGQLRDEKSIELFFNDAYFVCTLLVDYYQFPYLHIDDCKALIKTAYQLRYFISGINNALAERYSYIVLIVSYCLLKHIDNWENDAKLKRTIAGLEEKIQQDPNIKNILFAKITSATSKNKSIYSAQIYHRRKITKDILTGIDWYVLTQRYNIEEIKEIVGYAASSEEKTLLIESIQRNVKRYSRSNPANIDMGNLLESLKKIREEALSLVRSDWQDGLGTQDSSIGHSNADNTECLSKAHGCMVKDIDTEITRALSVYVEKGLFDENLSPKTISHPQIAYVASRISMKLWKEYRWKPFEKLWKINNLSSYYQRFMNQKNSYRFIELIGEIDK